MNAYFLIVIGSFSFSLTMVMLMRAWILQLQKPKGYLICYDCRFDDMGYCRKDLKRPWMDRSCYAFERGCYD